jgi:hypothetical protein
LDRPLLPEADEFIAQHIDTIHQLDVLVLMRHASDRAWSIDEIAEALGKSSSTVRSSVAGLLASGIVAYSPDESSGEWKYQPRSVALHAGVESVIEAYESDAVGVVKAVFNKPSRALRSFADAFVFRRRESP